MNHPHDVRNISSKRSSTIAYILRKLHTMSLRRRRRLAAHLSVEKIHHQSFCDRVNLPDFITASNVRGREVSGQTRGRAHQLSYRSELSTVIWMSLPEPQQWYTVDECVLMAKQNKIQRDSSVAENVVSE